MRGMDQNMRVVVEVVHLGQFQRLQQQGVPGVFVGCELGLETSKQQTLCFQQQIDRDRVGTTRTGGTSTAQQFIRWWWIGWIGLEWVGLGWSGLEWVGVVNNKNKMRQENDWGEYTFPSSLLPTTTTTKTTKTTKTTTDLFESIQTCPVLLDCGPGGIFWPIFGIAYGLNPPIFVRRPVFL